jgi:UDP-glucose 4-epimerase
MTILVTGGLGFIGNNLVRNLINTGVGDNIIVVDNLSCGKISFLADVKNKFTFYNADILDKDQLSKCFEKERPDIVIHLAAVHFIPECDADPARTMLVNIAGTHNIIDLANRWGVKQLIFASSASVYGPTRRKSRESDIPMPIETYGISKLCGEQMIKNLCRTNWSILRFFNIVGQDDTHEHLLPAIVKQLGHKKTISLGNSKSRRDYLFVGDLVDGIQGVVNNRRAYAQILNFGTGTGSSAEDMLREIGEILKEPLKVKRDSRLVRGIDNPGLVASTKKTKEVLGWEPKHTLRDALRKILETTREI